MSVWASVWRKLAHSAFLSLPRTHREHLSSSLKKAELLFLHWDKRHGYRWAQVSRHNHSLSSPGSSEGQREKPLNRLPQLQPDSSTHCCVMSVSLLPRRALRPPFVKKRATWLLSRPTWGCNDPSCENSISRGKPSPFSWPLPFFETSWCPFLIEKYELAAPKVKVEKGPWKDVSLSGYLKKTLGTGSTI